MTNRTLVCIGAGYTALAVAKLALRHGWRVVGTTRAASGVARLQDAQIEPVVFDGLAPSQALSQHLRAAEFVLISVGPDATAARAVAGDRRVAEGRQRDAVLRLHWDDLAQSPSLRGMCYLSTTGVYGDHGGGWVDETTPASPLSARSHARLAAEQAWQSVASAHGKARLAVFRLSGIYGPGRSPLERVRTGTARAVIKPGQVFNRIHVDDIAIAVEAVLSGRGQHVIYNVSDDEPAPPEDVLTFAASLIGVELPPPVPFDEAHLGEMARSFYHENKRVSNTRLKTDLGLTLRFPTYREGLAALL
ncbi:MAG: SDR family oxidoreductase [Hyphomicrobiaceae bacterium]